MDIQAPAILYMDHDRTTLPSIKSKGTRNASYTTTQQRQDHCYYKQLIFNHKSIELQDVK